MKSRSHGFTLIELMITVAIIAILAAVVYPSYTSVIRRSHRADARDALLQIQVAQEKYFLSNNGYATLANLYTASPIPTVVKSGTTYYTANQYYIVTFVSQSSTAYQVRAQAQGSQAGDGYCADFWITESGNKTATNADCWNK
jgi:type IV pilus assembly protein PilE